MPWTIIARPSTGMVLKAEIEHILVFLRKNSAVHIFNSLALRDVAVSGQTILLNDRSD